MSQSNETSGDRAYPKQKVFTAADGDARRRDDSPASQVSHVSSAHSP